jgi:hypothetical protein
MRVWDDNAHIEAAMAKDTKAADTATAAQALIGVKALYRLPTRPA